jgi:hypothetical protein
VRRALDSLQEKEAQMKACLILAVVLLLTPGLAAAEEAAPATADPFEGGGCVMPDLAGLSEDDATAALRSAGFDLSPIDAAAPACPITFSCNSITNCGIGMVCSITDIGPCCTTGGGLGLCCISGSIKVRQCPCTCTGSPCSVFCPQNTDVKWRCA